MSTDKTFEPVVKIEDLLYKCYSDLLSLISSFEKGSTADISARLRSVENNLQDLREAVKDTTNISSEEAYQFNKIRDLYRQIKQKDDLINTFGSDVISTGNNPSEIQLNDKAIICQHCTSVVILPNVGQWSDKTVELPLARQKKGVDTQTETLSGFWAIKDMMSFENVGFTRSVEGTKYLICADCEYGPIGYLDTESSLHFITPTRLKYKD